MKRILITAFTLAACAGTQLFAQNAKEDVITFNLTRQYQASVSTSSKANQGEWTDPPTYYKTKSSKLATKDILRAISVVLYDGNPNAYSSSAKLVLVQGELGGFFGLKTQREEDSEPVKYTLMYNQLYTNEVYSAVIGTNSTDQVGKFYPGEDKSTFRQLQPRLATGRHFKQNPDDGRLAPGHDQPWGQVFVKDQNGVCDNVTFFFQFEVVECYDCFYLNSFISDTTFKFTEKQGPPCCAGSSANTGSGKDKYLMTLSFDNTLANPYLNSESSDYVGWPGSTYPGIEGLAEEEDGLTPDALDYDKSISVAEPTDSHEYDIYVMRFTIGGIVTYSWSLKLLNSTDAVPDFVGNANYPVYGSGYIAKTCSFITGTASFAERSVKADKCCLNLPWYDSWYGVGYDYLGYGDSEVNIPTALTYHEIPYKGYAE